RPGHLERTYPSRQTESRKRRRAVDANSLNRSLQGLKHLDSRLHRIAGAFHLPNKSLRLGFPPLESPPLVASLNPLGFDLLDSLPAFVQLPESLLQSRYLVLQLRTLLSERDT